MNKHPRFKGVYNLYEHKLNLFQPSKQVVTEKVEVDINTEEGINGFLFQNEDVDDLVRVMEEAVNRSQDEYNKLKNSMQHYTEFHYSPWQIASKWTP